MFLFIILRWLLLIGFRSAGRAVKPLCVREAVSSRTVQVTAPSWGLSHPSASRPGAEQLHSPHHLLSWRSVPGPAKGGLKALQTLQNKSFLFYNVYARPVAPTTGKYLLYIVLQWNLKPGAAGTCIHHQHSRGWGRSITELKARLGYSDNLSKNSAIK